MNRFKYPAADIEKAVRFLKKKRGQPPNFITKFPGQFTVKHGKLYAGNRRVIAAEKKEEYLRDVIYGKKSEYPFGRDSLFLLLKNEVLGVSKRDIEAFLNEQGPLVHRRSRPKKETRENLRQIRKPGILSVDLAHIRAKDFEAILGEGEGLDYMGAPGKRGYQQDRYFLNGVCLLTGYLVTEVLHGKTARETWPKLLKIINEYEKAFGVRVRQIEIDKGREFYGAKAVPNKDDPSKSLPALSFAKELKDRDDGATPVAKKIPIRLIRKITNAAVEQTNAKMQRIFWALVEQRRGGFKTTWKQAVRISNRTRNRRTGMTPEQAMKKLKAGEPVVRTKPKARTTERKKAWKVGDKVRPLKKPRAKADDLGYKAYKGQHFGAVTPITAVKFMGVHPKYKVGARWLWQDEVIKARPEDTKSHNLYINRPVVLPEKMIPKRKPKKRVKPPKGKFSQWQDIWIVKPGYGKRLGGKILSIDGDILKVEYWWAQSKEMFDDEIYKKEARPMRTYEIEDKVKVFEKETGKWYNAEVDKHEAKGFYRVFWRERGRNFSLTVPGAMIRPR